MCVAEGTYPPPQILLSVSQILYCMLYGGFIVVHMRLKRSLSAPLREIVQRGLPLTQNACRAWLHSRRFWCWRGADATRSRGRVFTIPG